MTFTLEIKKEIVLQGFADKAALQECKKQGAADIYAALSAFLRTSAFLGVKDGVPSFFLVSETEFVAEYVMQQFAECFSFDLQITGATMDRLSGRDKLVMQCPAGKGVGVLTTLGLLKRGDREIKEGISSALVKTDENKISYIKGAFLGGGSCILPTRKSAGYHLEFSFSSKKVAQDFCDLLGYFELIAKLVERKESFVVYMKSKELISDFLALIGAQRTLEKFNAFVEKRDASNNDNRAKNCRAGNADKTAIAAVKQVLAIQKLQQDKSFVELPIPLKMLAKTRLQYPTASLKELAEMLGESKSCINHRIRKLMELASEL